jgi:undecaprenyl phosphate N,N'-diacetylbacillosamine 1-phosphate transferase
MSGETKPNTTYKPKKHRGIYRRCIKRPMDILLSLIALIVLSPLLLVVAILVKIKLGSPVIFKQERPGLNEKIFTLYKFRTMTDERDNEGQLLPNHLRLTKFGRMLRATSLDELPELFNILRGDMSVIGPRPLLIEYLPLYDEKQKHRHDVRPGLSGLAQVSGRNGISWEDKFHYDIEYIENVSFLLDVKLITKTLLKAFRREGVNKSETVTMEKFQGHAFNTDVGERD